MIAAVHRVQSQEVAHTDRVDAKAAGGAVIAISMEKARIRCNNKPSKARKSIREVAVFMRGVVAEKFRPARVYGKDPPECGAPAIHQTAGVDVQMLDRCGDRSHVHRFAIRHEMAVERQLAFKPFSEFRAMHWYRRLRVLDFS